MASARYDFGFSPEDADERVVRNWGKPSARGPTPVNRERGSVEIGGFTKIPNRLFTSGMAGTLRSSATLLYVALCDHANRNGSNTFKASDKALASDTTLSPRTISDARKRLIENELIIVAREKGQSYFYTLTVQKLDWVPLAKRPRAKLSPRAYHAQTATVPNKLKP